MAGSNLGFGGSNPYVQNQAKALQASSNQNLQQNVLPGIGQGAQMAGGYGGSRQGIAQGMAIGNAQTGLDASIAGLYSNAYGQDLNAKLQREGLANQMGIASMQNATQNKGLDNSFTLGQGNLDLGRTQSANAYTLGQGNLALGNKQSDNTYALGRGQLQNQSLANANSYDLGLRSNDYQFANLDANIANSNFGNQLASANFGLNAYNAMNGQTQTGINAGTTIQNTPLDYQKYFTNSANGTGSGFASSSTNNAGNPYASAMGGAMIGNNLYNQYKG